MKLENIDIKIPLVSVVVPSYNHERFIEQCIISIINQSYKNFELIVIDDGSTDSSREILRSLQSKYDFKLILQENIGLSKTFNKVIKNYCKGKFFTFCASDDYWVVDKLEKQVTFMDSNPDIPMCYGKAYIVDEESNIIEKSTYLKNKSLRGGEIFKDLLLINFHPPVNYLFRKSIFDEVGYYREDIFTEDLYMNLKIANKYKIGYIDDFLMYYRQIENILNKPATVKTSISHLKCINEYKNSEYYQAAIIKWNFRNFIWYAPYKQHKLLAFKGMFFSVRFFYRKSYLMSIFILATKWK